VEISFLFYVGDNDSGGADGLALTAYDTTRNPSGSYVGTNGDGLGFGGLMGWHIAVDTWYNAERDDFIDTASPAGNDHISIVFDGAYDATEKDVDVSNLEDGAWHTLHVKVVGTYFEVSLDGTLVVDEDFPGAPAAFPAHIGFSAGTGSAVNDHRIDSLTVTGMVCD
jgi:hypothetical protein